MHSKLTGASAMRGTAMRSHGAAVSPAAANSSTSGGYSIEVMTSSSSSSAVGMLTTNSRLSRTNARVSLTPLPGTSDFDTENPSIGGSDDTMLKKLKGAMLGTPLGDRQDTHAIGRGTTAPHSSL